MLICKTLNKMFYKQHFLFYYVLQITIDLFEVINNKKNLNKNFYFYMLDHIG